MIYVSVFGLRSNVSIRIRFESVWSSEFQSAFRKRSAGNEISAVIARTYLDTLTRSFHYNISMQIQNMSNDRRTTISMYGDETDVFRFSRRRSEAIPPVLIIIIYFKVFFFHLTIIASAESFYIIVIAPIYNTYRLRTFTHDIESYYRIKLANSRFCSFKYFLGKRLLILPICSAVNSKKHDKIVTDFVLRKMTYHV